MLVKSQERQQTRDAAISIPERMDTEEIQYKTRNGQQGRCTPLGHDVTVRQAQLIYCRWSLGGFNRTKAHKRRRPLP